jgi:hypothetical protein
MTSLIATRRFENLGRPQEFAMTESVQLTRQNKSERKAIKNARQRRQRMIEGAFDRLHGVGQMYDCKVYMVLQTPEGQFKTYSNTKGQNWPPSRHQIVSSGPWNQVCSSIELMV